MQRTLCRRRAPRNACCNSCMASASKYTVFMHNGSKPYACEFDAACAIMSHRRLSGVCASLQHPQGQQGCPCLPRPPPHPPPPPPLPPAPPCSNAAINMFIVFVSVHMWSYSSCLQCLQCCLTFALYCCTSSIPLQCSSKLVGTIVAKWDKPSMH